MDNKPEPIVFTPEELKFIDVYMECFDPEKSAQVAFDIENKNLAYLKGRDVLKRPHVSKLIRDRVTVDINPENIVIDIYSIVKSGQDVPKGLAQMWSLLCEVLGMKKIEFILKYKREDVTPEDIRNFISRNKEHLPEEYKLLDDGHK